MDDDAVARVRSFNRTVTQRVGALRDRYLARQRSLGEARVLWEIGHGGRDVRELRRRLDLDSGYLSRLLAALEAAGLVAAGTSQADRRVRTVRLTAKGRRERRLLDQRSDELARSFLDPLNDKQRTALLDAMGTVERLLTAAIVEVRPRDPEHPHARQCFEHYVAELQRRFDAGFDPGRSISAEAHELRDPNGTVLIAYLHDEPIGCGALKFHANAPTEVKRMWVDPKARGLGVGRRLLRELEDHARRQNATSVLHLETNRNLTQARALYRAAGYVEVPPFNDEPYAHHWFEKRLQA